MVKVVKSSLPIKEAGLVLGIVLGDKSGFSHQFYQKLIDSGLVHIVVASGTNVMLVSSLVIENLAYILGRKKAIVVGLGVLWWYALMVGLEAPILRASLLMTIFYWSRLLGRKYSLSRGLLVTVAIMLLIDWQMIKEVSFWLSLMAFLGVLTYRGRHSWALTLWVMVWVWPILSLVFGRLALLSFVFNMLVLFLVETISLVGLGAMLVGLVWPMVARWWLWLIYPLLRYFVMVVEWGADLNWIVDFNFNWWMLVGWYLILFWWLEKRKKRQKLCC